jgi:hypothetical protein
VDDLKGRREGVDVDPHENPAKPEGCIRIAERAKQFNAATYTRKKNIDPATAL